MENHSCVTGHQGSRLLKRVWGGGGGPQYKCQLSVRVRVRLSVK